MDKEKKNNFDLAKVMRLEGKKMMKEYKKLKKSEKSKRSEKEAVNVGVEHNSDSLKAQNATSKNLSEKIKQECNEIHHTHYMHSIPSCDECIDLAISKTEKAKDEEFEEYKKETDTLIFGFSRQLDLKEEEFAQDINKEMQKVAREIKEVLEKLALTKMPKNKWEEYGKQVWTGINKENWNLFWKKYLGDEK